MASTTSTTAIPDLVKAAQAAYNDEEASHDAQQEQGRRIEVGRILELLTKHDIEPCGEPFINWVSSKVCVPLIAPGWDMERETQIHAVAAEWDGQSYEIGLLLVADGDVDGSDWDSRRLYATGRLTSLADLGRAIERGGRPPMVAPTAADRVRRAIGSVTADYAGPNAEAVLAAADAICEALLDIAQAVREDRGGF